jgi:hypothetical protein
MMRSHEIFVLLCKLLCAFAAWPPPRFMSNPDLPPAFFLLHISPVQSLMSIVFLFVCVLFAHLIDEGERSDSGKGFTLFSSIATSHIALSFLLTIDRIVGGIL